MRTMGKWLVVAGIAALALTTTCLGCASKRTFSHQAITVLADTMPQEKWRIPQPDSAEAAWAYVQSCMAPFAIDTAQTQTTLAGIRWYETRMWERTADEIASDSNPDNDTVALGNWGIANDGVAEITLARRTRLPNGTHRLWTVAHELAHHLLQGPVREGPFDTGHPFVPFAYPCKLMAWQHLGEWDRRANLDEEPK